ncbi:hypothetical protein LZ554_007163 [Drepanopeziza brunnea f. sp. 'monogermtubi']|nr:hypothetical protein LZ554_007163 [Drepanopeziza brunnea f. sp. 'monogermtubi']
MFQRLHDLFQRNTLSFYTAHPTSQRLSAAYLILEYISPDMGQMLSITWEKHRKDSFHRQNLFQGMARVMLSLAKIPQPRIGSFQFDDNGTITLTNRPLLCSTVILENEDMLTLHDNSFLSNPNATYGEDDCRSQMAVKALLRMLSHHYVERKRHNGPFYLQCTDLHPSNIFVDEQWNITCLIDLEWISALPAEMLDVPDWLTGQGIDEILDDKLHEFDATRQEFMKIFEAEEIKMASDQKHLLADTMCKSWESSGLWFWWCLGPTNAMISVVEDHICPRFSYLSSEAAETISRFWQPDSAKIVEKKMADYKGYEKDLGALFGRQAQLQDS